MDVTPRSRCGRETTGVLSPVDGSKLRVTGIAAVAKVLGVEAGDVVDDRV